MSPPHKPKISLIVLAAGASSRLNGASKQLLVYGGKTLLRRAAETALQSTFETVVVVLSTDGEIFSGEIEDLPVRTVINEDAKSGISSSIKTGLSFISEEDDAVIIMLCDQPFITTKTLQKLGDVFVETGKPIIACEYEGVFGVPALFARAFFSELMNLSEDEGAKKLIKKYRDQTEFVQCPEAATDVDTLEDYQKLILQSF